MWEKECSREDNAVGMIISQMKNLNLNDPRSRAFLAEVMQRDPFLTRQLRDINMYAFGATQDSRRDLPPHMSNQQRFIPNNSTGVYNGPRQCYGCGRMGYTISRCEEVQLSGPLYPNTLSVHWSRLRTLVSLVISGRLSFSTIRFSESKRLPLEPQ